MKYYRTIIVMQQLNSYQSIFIHNCEYKTLEKWLLKSLEADLIRVFLVGYRVYIAVLQIRAGQRLFTARSIYLLDFISVYELNAKEVAFADDFTVAGKLSSIKDYWSQLTSIGPEYGYFPKASKSYLIVKEDQLPSAITLFHNSNVNITVEGKKAFGSYYWKWQS